MDAGAPVVVLRAADLGLTARELPAAIDGDAELLAHLDQVRRAGAVAMGMAASPADAARAVPKLAMVGPSEDGVEEDLHVRMLSMGKVHPALPVTGSVALTLAARTPGTLVADVLLAPAASELRLHAPSGLLTTRHAVEDGSTVASVLRTYRVLAEGVVHLPLTRWKAVP